MDLLIWPMAFTIGIVLGLFGAGGGMITVPALIYLLHMPVKQAIAMSLWIVAIVSFVALIQQRAWRKLQLPLLLTFGVTGVLGSTTGSLLAQYVPETVQLVAFSLLIFFTTWWTSRVELTNQVSVFRFIPATLTGFGVGVLTGILGVGGGFLLVPAVIYLGIGHFPTAVAHSLILVTLNALAGGITYATTIDFSIQTTLTISGIAIVGSAVGSHLLKRISGQRLQRVFSLMLFFLGAFMLVRIL